MTLFIHLPGFVHTYNIICAYVCHDSFIHAPWLIHMQMDSIAAVKSPEITCHDPFIHVPWRIHTCTSIHSYMCHDPFTCRWIREAAVKLMHMSAMGMCAMRMCAMHMCAMCLTHRYGVATISRLLKIIRLFCRIPSLLQGSFAKETYNFKEPTNRSHPIPWPFHTCAMTHSYAGGFERQQSRR